MSSKISRSLSYTHGIGYQTGGGSNKFLHRMAGRTRPLYRMMVCESCGQSHEADRNHLYDYPEELDDDLMCQICLQPLVDPVDTPCSHTFCHSCILHYMNRPHPSCPTDRQPIAPSDIRQSNLLVRKILDKLKVVCPNTAYCDEMMPRATLERHLKAVCPGTYVNCPRSTRGCMYMGPRCQLEEHLWTCFFGEDTNPRTGKKLLIREGSPCVIEIPKGREDLGLNVSKCELTGALIIDEVYVSGQAYKDGRLMPGDEIKEIDGIPFTHKTLGQTRLALSFNKPIIKLTILRQPQQEEDSIDVEEVQLIKDEFRPLGIQLHTYKTQPGVYVYHLVPGSPAEEHGSLQVGDRILEVNYTDMRNATIDQTATLMAKSQGIVQLLIAHKHRLSPTCSDTSTKSFASSLGSHASSSRQSYNTFTLPKRSMSLRQHRLYEEIVSSTGYRIGGEKCILLKKLSEESLGINVAGGNEGDDDEEGLPVYISSVRPGGVAWRSRLIQKGDIIVSINGILLIGKSSIQASQLIESLVTNGNRLIALELIQGDDSYEEDGGLSPEWSYWLESYMVQRKCPLEYTITLLRDGHSSLGFSLVGGVGSPKGDSPIYVKSVATKSIAANDGRLQCRDCITCINGIQVSDKTQGQVVDIIRSSHGEISITLVPNFLTQ